MTTKHWALPFTGHLRLIIRDHSIQEVRIFKLRVRMTSWLMSGQSVLYLGRFQSITHNQYHLRRHLALLLLLGCQWFPRKNIIKCRIILTDLVIYRHKTTISAQLAKNRVSSVPALLLKKLSFSEMFLYFYFMPRDI